jgi:ATP-binding cassette subfamily B protein
MNATAIAVYWFGGQQLLGGQMNTGDFASFVTYITQILSSLMMVTFLFMMFSRSMASAKRIAEVMNEEIDIVDAANTSEYTVQKGEVEFRNVSFQYYKDSEEKVLDNINLKINAGETIGIIGSTGCGKTTLVSMIARLYDVDEGEVLVDGVNVKNYSLYNLREGVGMVLQKNILFSGSIIDNLRWGDNEATMEEIREAADYAQADGFITSFVEGYNMDLGQGGTNVSGGQKQRLCIARALLKKPKILILDDSTSAVDMATEARIRDAFKNSIGDSTKIIIAQRINSVKDADEIIVLDEGRITGIGTHEYLLENNETYQEIYYSQMDKKEDNK